MANRFLVERLKSRQDQQMAESARLKYWEIIADNLSKAGWSWGYVSAIDSNGRTIWIADAHLVTEASVYLRRGA